MICLIFANNYKIFLFEKLLEHIYYTIKQSQLEGQELYNNKLYNTYAM